MNHRHRWWVTLLVVAAVAAVAASASTGSAKAAKYMTVSQGAGAAALAGYTPFDPTDPSTPETVTFVLRAQNVDHLQSQVQAGMPDGYLSTSDFANRYGQPKPVVLAIQAYLAHYGIHSHAMPDNLDIQSTGTAGQYNNAFQIVQQNFMVPAVGAHGSHGHGHGTITVHGSSQNPKVPSDWGPFILAILGLSNYPTQQSDMIGTADGVSTQGLNNTALHPSDFATRYNLDPVTAAGGTGHGRTIGIVTLAADRPDTVSQFWNDIGLTGSQASQSRITTINIDGGPGAPNENAGSDETTLDMEQSGALAPDANLSVYQAPNTDAGFVDAFYQAAADNTADTVSASWGESETLIKAFTNIGLEDPNYANAFSQAFLEMDAQGQSMFLSSGDSGAYPASRDLGSTDRTAGNPDDSPWATSSGGTTLPGPFQVHDLTFNFPTERTWAWDYLWGPRSAELGQPEIAYAESHVVGGGGGYSGFFSMPSYQKGVKGTANYSAVEYLQPTAFSTTNPFFGVDFGISLPYDWNFNPTPNVTKAGAGNAGRATPDLSADADPETGYLVLYNFGDSSNPSAPPSFEQFGGTSFVAPQLNGAAAAIDSLLGHRVGFWNPAMYKFAVSKNSPFTPLDATGTSNDNLYYTGTKGNIYNVGSGLGTPDLAKLAGDFGLLAH
ncbi:MAG TPA: S53 family peptidase [Gaiellaceae bacterium]|jgi:subtilase family serine protease